MRPKSFAASKSITTQIYCFKTYQLRRKKLSAVKPYGLVADNYYNIRFVCTPLNIKEKRLQLRIFLSVEYFVQVLYVEVSADVADILSYPSTTGHLLPVPSRGNKHKFSKTFFLSAKVNYCRQYLHGGFAIKLNCYSNSLLLVKTLTSEITKKTNEKINYLHNRAE